MGNRADIKDDLHSLVKETVEYVSYLRELGVGGVEDSSIPVLAQTGASSAEKAVARTDSPVVNPALQRNAKASTRTESPPGNAPQASRTARVTSTSPEQTDMAKRTTKKTPELEPPPPQETLFGEITPKDEASLPRTDETFEDIWNDIGECVRCPLHAGRTHIVNTEGNRKARLMFVGEAPGADEDMQARPFVGRAGQLLNKIIEAIGMKREDILIGNVNRCRPPQNRTPTLEEAKTCKPFLLREIAVVQPDVIVVLGNTAMKNLLDTKEGITKVRGKFQDYKGIKVMPTFHPAYLLRDPSKKREAWEDMKKVRDYLDGKIKG
jgi:uracil-DNA glycosylase family 4